MNVPDDDRLDSCDIGGARRLDDLDIPWLILFADLIGRERDEAERELVQRFRAWLARRES